MSSESKKFDGQQSAPAVVDKCEILPEIEPPIIPYTETMDVTKPSKGECVITYLNIGYQKFEAIASINVIDRDEDFQSVNNVAAEEPAITIEELTKNVEEIIGQKFDEVFKFAEPSEIRYIGKPWSFKYRGK